MDFTSRPGDSMIGSAWKLSDFCWPLLETCCTRLALSLRSSQIHYLTRVNCLTCDFICQTTQVAISHEKTKSSQLMAKNTWFEVKRCPIYLDWCVIPRGQDPVGVTALPANNMSQYEVSSSAIACEKDQNIASCKFTFPSCSQHIHVHLGMYMSTYSPALFCMMKVGFGFSEKNEI